ncbi:hypothetical protein AVEN_193939-1 [Araneus ventricosus]|uniref:Uncharacterized protein n=1 Tax=Araneus ventricosus TaxID=182803 RepID=A0A4Y2W0B2_ARAVE|nr:hypothetical protein AVEN_183124-1 [Araneus ventricosus]GBO40253.1 hypothetical protein AVEN_193939-1 [Araneus ventricosus]
MSIGLLITCILEIFLHPTLREWVRSYLCLQNFKSADEEHMYQVSSKSPNLSFSLFVTCILATMPHYTMREWVRAYLPLQYFKPANEESLYQVSSRLVEPFGCDAGTNINT